MAMVRHQTQAVGLLQLLRLVRVMPEVMEQEHQIITLAVVAAQVVPVQTVGRMVAMEELH